MKKSQFTPAQIADILKEFDQGRTAAEISRTHGISRQTLYRWRSQYGGIDESALKRIKALEEENAKLRQMSKSIALDLEIARFIIKNAP